MSSFFDGEIHVWQTATRQTPPEIFASALRFAAQGHRAVLVQFLKGGIDQGPEHPRTLAQNLHWLRPDIGRIVDCYFEDAERVAIQVLWQHIEACKADYDLLVFDEIGLAVDLGLVTEDQLLKLLKEKLPHQEIVLSGQKIPDSVRPLASQWSEISRPSRSGKIT
ncbi:MAG: cob(I)yrinic acid a,c-diamide adenosyltransferase [Anaerolineae bacterium]|nr:cob(I)yrinic acid a,c-diamide adenosyltransferase [Gloeobacterales cyanobacterium ES-bin-313]